LVISHDCFFFNLDEPQDFQEKGLKFKKILFISLKILGGPKDTLAPPTLISGGGGAMAPLAPPVPPPLLIGKQITKSYVAIFVDN
jgi:hypothetical protein